MKLKVLEEQLREHYSQREKVSACLAADQRNLDAVDRAIQAVELLVAKEKERLKKGVKNGGTS